jgi:hypothetical protein
MYNQIKTIRACIYNERIRILTIQKNPFTYPGNNFCVIFEFYPILKFGFLLMKICKKKISDAS